MRYFTFLLILLCAACQKPLNIPERIVEIDNLCAEVENNTNNYTVQTVDNFKEGEQQATLVLLSDKTTSKPVLLIYLSKTIEQYELYFYFEPRKQQLVYVKELGIDFATGEQYENGFYYSHKKNIKAQTRITNCNHANGEHNHNHNWEDYVPARADDFRLNYAEISATAKQLSQTQDLKTQK